MKWWPLKRWSDFLLDYPLVNTKKPWALSIRLEVLVKNLDNFVWLMEQHFLIGRSNPVTSSSIDSNCVRGWIDQWNGVFWSFRNSGIFKTTSRGVAKFPIFFLPEYFRSSHSLPVFFEICGRMESAPHLFSYRGPHHRISPLLQLGGHIFCLEPGTGLSKVWITLSTQKGGPWA